jgi:hypothetical protein
MKMCTNPAERKQDVIYLINRNLSKSIVAIIILLALEGCKKLIEIGPPNSIVSETAYNSDATAAAVLTGIYTYMSNGSNYPLATGVNSISVQMGLSADELTLFSGSTNSQLINTYKNSLTADITPLFWLNLYYYILVSNEAIAGISKSQKLTPAVKNQLLGEAYFIRSFCYFYLTNIYGDIPLLLNGNYYENSIQPKSSLVDIYNSIINDLIKAQGLLSHDYKSSNAQTNTTERVRPNLDAATSLLARCYLYIGKYSDADREATKVIDYKTQYDTVSLNSVFLKNSKEAIWQLQPVVSNWNTQDARLFILTSASPNSTNPVYLSQFLLESLPINDLRRGTWIKSIKNSLGQTYFYPYKYKSATSGSPVIEYLMVIRLAELYLIRAEARLKFGNIGDSKNDLNVIRRRAGLNNIITTDDNEVLKAIILERKNELFCEWGHRWFDLKRSKQVDEVMPSVTSIKGGNWSPYRALFPIPNSDILRNPSLRNAQNPGYN